ncbi:MAG: antibiotic biosynthesis monooxygenase [Salinibacter sp.]
MLVRIVRMTFAPNTVDQFLDQFDEAAPLIRSFSGCRHLELWRDLDASAVCTTYSHWKHPEALATYKDSDLFRHTWSAVTPLFADRPRAQSYTVTRTAAAIEDRAQTDSTSDAP